MPKKKSSKTKTETELSDVSESNVGKKKSSKSKTEEFDVSESFVSEPSAEELEHATALLRDTGALFKSALYEQKKEMSTTCAAVAKQLGVDLAQGLANKQVEELRVKYGENRLPPKRRKKFYE